MSVPGTGSFWPQRYHDRNVRNAEEFAAEAALPVPESGETQTGEGSERLELEQLPALCFPRDGRGGD